MRSALARVRAFYGAHPLHLLALAACFALAGYAITFIAHDPSLPRILIWFGAAVIAHDLVLFPLYALADRAVTTLFRPRDRVHRTPLVPPLNYLRTPTLASGLVLLIFLPGIIGQGSVTYHAATGQTQQPYLGRWLLLTAAFYLLSAVIYTARVVHTRRTHPPRSTTDPTPPAAEHQPPPDPGRTATRIRVSTVAAVALLLGCAASGVLRARKHGPRRARAVAGGRASSTGMWHENR